MAFNIVLIEPEIPNNTGNIGRLALATQSNLHIVKPLGFEITDARLKRAGLDYWQHLNVTYYENTLDFFEQNITEKMVFLSSHGTQNHWEIPFSDDIFLVFGKESQGLGEEIIKNHTADMYKIPLFSPKIRSLNIANSVGIVVYEGLRQLKS